MSICLFNFIGSINVSTGILPGPDVGYVNRQIKNEQNVAKIGVPTQVYYLNIKSIQNQNYRSVLQQFKHT